MIQDVATISQTKKGTKIPAIYLDLTLIRFLKSSNGLGILRSNN